LHSSTTDPLKGAAEDQLVHISCAAAQHTADSEYHIGEEETVFPAKNIAKLSI